MSRVSRLVLCSVLLLAFSPCVAQGQSSTLPSTDTAPPSSVTTPTADSVLQTLKPLLEAAFASSQDSDSNSVTLQQQIEQDRLQKIADDKQRQIEQQQRQKEQQDSATAYSLLSSRAETLQSYFDALSSKLTDFSGSEDQKQAAALAAVDKIMADAKALELEAGILKVGVITFGVTTAAGAGWIVGHYVFKWW